MKRKILTIDEGLCDGCGNCVSDCSEGAIQIINGKAKLVKEQFCDGFGDCIGSCPTGALKIEDREAGEFDLNATKDHVLNSLGAEAVRKMELAQQKHHATDQQRTARPAVPHMPGGCPGSRMRIVDEADTARPNTGDTPINGIPSELRQWPIQLHLVSPAAPFFKGKELVVLNPCGPVASGDVHWRYLRGRSVVIGCPKLDDTQGYAEKLGLILSETSIPKVIVVRMEVPCCGGLTQITREAIALSQRNDLVFQEDILSLDGTLKESHQIPIPMARPRELSNEKTGADTRKGILSRFQTRG